MPEVFITSRQRTAWQYRQLIEPSDDPFVILMNNQYASVTLTGLSVNGQKAGDQRLLVNYGAFPIELITNASVPAAYRFLGNATLTAYGSLRIVNRGAGWRPITQPVSGVSDVASGTKGSGLLTVATLPANTDTQVIAGVTFTYKTTPTTNADVQVVTSTKEAQAEALATTLTANPTASALATYEDMGDGTVLVTAISPGTAGNAIATANSTGNKITASSATLAGGTDGYTGAWTVVASAAASVSPTAADSGKYYRLSHATPTFNLPTTGLVVGKTEFWLTLAAANGQTGAVESGAGKTIDYQTFSAGVSAGAADQSINTMWTFRLYHIKYVATNVWASDIIREV